MWLGGHWLPTPPPPPWPPEPLTIPPAKPPSPELVLAAPPSAPAPPLPAAEPELDPLDDEGALPELVVPSSSDSSDVNSEQPARCGIASTASARRCATRID